MNILSLNSAIRRQIVRTLFIAHKKSLTEDLSKNISFYKRYVDDILVIRERKEDMNCLLDKLNTYKPHRSFMCRGEERLVFFSYK